MTKPESYIDVPWRTGTQVLRTIYACPPGSSHRNGEVLIGLMDTAELAREVVEAHNARIETDARVMALESKLKTAEELDAEIVRCDKARIVELEALLQRWVDIVCSRHTIPSPTPRFLPVLRDTGSAIGYYGPGDCDDHGYGERCDNPGHWHRDAALGAP
jgi:hypothetical protein